MMFAAADAVGALFEMIGLIATGIAGAAGLVWFACFIEKVHRLEVELDQLRSDFSQFINEGK